MTSSLIVTRIITSVDHLCENQEDSRCLMTSLLLSYAGCRVMGSLSAVNSLFSDSGIVLAAKTVN